MQIILLDYSNGVATVFTISDDIRDIEKYLIENYDYKESEMDWMELRRLEFGNLGEI